MKHTESDIIILGAGVVGLTTALALTKKGLRVHVLDKAAEILRSDGQAVDTRVFAIMPKVKNIFMDLGIWQTITELGVSPYRSMCVWEKEVEYAIHFSANEVGLAELGFIIEQRVLLKALLQACKQQPSFTLHFEMDPAKLTLTEKSAMIITDDAIFEASLIIGADGAHSWLREQSGIPITQWDYKQQAIVATVTTEKSHGLCARQRFLKTGPVAFLPLANPHQCSIVWTVDKAVSDGIFNETEEAFISQLQTAFPVLGKIQAISKRYMFPLSMRHTQQYVQSRIALIGDAAHTLHPLAGLGMNLGLLDAKELTKTILYAHSKQRDIGSYHHLRPYERARKGHNLAMIAVMEGFKQLFSSDYSAVRTLRQWGLNRVNANQFIKNRIMTSFVDKR